MPFARHAGGVTGLLQELGNGYFGGPHVNGPPSRYPIVDTGPIRTAPGQQANPRRRANRSGGIKVGEPNAFLGHLVEVRRLDLRVPVAGKIAIAEVIAKNDHYIGLLSLFGMQG